MEPSTRDQIAGLRAEIRHHREQAQRLRKARQAALRRRDPIAALRHLFAAGERAQYARQAERRIAELRATLPK